MKCNNNFNNIVLHYLAECLVNTLPIATGESNFQPTQHCRGLKTGHRDDFMEQCCFIVHEQLVI